MSIPRGESFIYQQKKNIYGKYGSEQPRKERNNKGGENALNNSDHKKRENMETIKKKKSDQTSVSLTEKNQVRSGVRTSFDEKPVRKREKAPKAKKTLELIPKSGGISYEAKKHHKMEDRANRKILDEKRSSAGTKVSQYLEEARKMVADAKGPRKASTPGHSLRQAMSPSRRFNEEFGVGQQESTNQMYPANYGQAVLPRNTYNSPMPQHNQYGMQQPISAFPPKDIDLFSNDHLSKNHLVQDRIPRDMMDTRNVSDNIPSHQLQRNHYGQDSVARDTMNTRNVLDHIPSHELQRRFQQIQPFDPVEQRKEHELKLALLKGPKKKMKPIINFAVSEVDKLVCSRLDQQSDSQQPLKPLGSLISTKTPLGPIVDKPLSHSALHSDYMLPSYFGKPTSSIRESSFPSLDIVVNSTPSCDTRSTNHGVLHDIIPPTTNEFKRPETPSGPANNNKSSMSAVFQSDHMLPSSPDQPESNHCEEFVAKLEVPKNTTPEGDMGLAFTEILTSSNESNPNAYDGPSSNLHAMSDDDTTSSKAQGVTSKRSLFKNYETCIVAECAKVPTLASESSCKAEISFSTAQTQTIRADVVSVSTNTPQQISSSVATQIDTPCKNCSPCSASFGDSLSNQAATGSVATATVRSVGTQTDGSCFCQAFPRKVSGSVGERYEVVRRDQGRILLRRIYETGDEPGMVDILRASYNVSGLIPIPPNRNSPYESLYNYIFDETSICDEHTSATTEGEDIVEPQVPFTKRKKSSTLSRMKSKFGVEPSSSKRKRYKPSKPKQVEPLFEDTSRAALLERVRALFKRIRNRPKEDYYGIDLLSRVRR